MCSLTTFIFYTNLSYLSIVFLKKVILYKTIVLFNSNITAKPTKLIGVALFIVIKLQRYRTENYA